MDNKDFAFGRMNFILLGVGMLVVVIGFLLMAGGSSTTDAYNPDIFSARRIKGTHRVLARLRVDDLRRGSQPREEESLQERN